MAAVSQPPIEPQDTLAFVQITTDMPSPRHPHQTFVLTHRNPLGMLKAGQFKTEAVT